MNSPPPTPSPTSSLHKLTHLVELPGVVPREPDEDRSAVLLLHNVGDRRLGRGDRRLVGLASGASPVDGRGSRGGGGRGGEADAHGNRLIA